MLRKFLLTICACFGAFQVHAATVTWGSQIDIGFVIAPDVMLELNSLVEVGVFDVSLSTVQANANDFAYLQSHFTALDTSRIGTGVGSVTGHFADGFTVGTKTTESSLGGQLLYMWAFKSTDNSTVGQSINTATHFALVTMTDNSWLMPTDPLVGVPSTGLIDLSQLGNGNSPASGATFILGSYPTTANDNAAYGGPNSNHVRLALVPEPSSVWLAGVGVLALIGRRRRCSA